MVDRSHRTNGTALPHRGFAANRQVAANVQRCRIRTEAYIQTSHPAIRLGARRQAGRTTLDERFGEVPVGIRGTADVQGVANHPSGNPVGVDRPLGLRHPIPGSRRPKGVVVFPRLRRCTGKRDEEECKLGAASTRQCRSGKIPGFDDPTGSIGFVGGKVVAIVPLVFGRNNQRAIGGCVARDIKAHASGSIRGQGESPRSRHRTRLAVAATRNNVFGQVGNIDKVPGIGFGSPSAPAIVYGNLPTRTIAPRRGGGIVVFVLSAADQQNAVRHAVHSGNFQVPDSTVGFRIAPVGCRWAADFLQQVCIDITLGKLG